MPGGENGVTGDWPAVPPTEPTHPSDRYLWLEVGAVLCLAVLPAVGHSILSWLLDYREALYAEARDSWWLIIRSIQVAVPVLFILWRSGEGWARFGIVPVRWGRDLALAAALAGAVFAVEWALWYMIYPLLVEAGYERIQASGGLTLRLPDLAPFLAAVPVDLANGFAEELVMRAYLITRLERLLGNTSRAVLASAALFGAYHLYQGPWGAAATFLIGVILGIAYARVRRLAPIAGAHALFNLIPHFLARAA